MLWLENNASLFSVRKNKRSKDLIIPAQKYLTFVSRFFCKKVLQTIIKKCPKQAWEDRGIDQFPRKGEREYAGQEDNNFGTGTCACHT